MRRLIFCFDGSWNKLSNPEPTNVVLVAESIAPVDDDGRDQIVYYDEGVGTGKSDRFRGGALGVGLVTNIREAYRFLIFNYQPGDEIFVFGFSRGAFTAMSFVGFLRTAGILTVSDACQIDEAFALYQSHSASVDDDPAAIRKFRADFSPLVVVDEADRTWRKEKTYDAAVVAAASLLQVKYLGVWDIVASLGLPSFLGPLATWYDRRYGFHYARRSKTALSARHAVAIDEVRAHFAPTVWNNIEQLNAESGGNTYGEGAVYQQQWFPGDHGSVGGGGPERGHSNAALAWLLAGAVAAGLKVQFGPKSRISGLAGDYRAPLINTPLRPGWATFKYKLVRRLLHRARKGPDDAAWVSVPAKRRWLAAAGVLNERVAYRPAPLMEVGPQIDRQRDRFTADDRITVVASHMVKQGENLGTIAKAYYGDSKLFGAIFDANRDVLDDPNRIYPGQILRIPPKPTTPLNPSSAAASVAPAPT